MADGRPNDLIMILDPQTHLIAPGRIGSVQGSIIN
jgi:hypothetical protein